MLARPPATLTSVGTVKIWTDSAVMDTLLSWSSFMKSFCSCVKCWKHEDGTCWFQHVDLSLYNSSLFLPLWTQVQKFFWTRSPSACCRKSVHALSSELLERIITLISDVTEMKSSLGEHQDPCLWTFWHRGAWVCWWGTAGRCPSYYPAPPDRRPAWIQLSKHQCKFTHLWTERLCNVRIYICELFCDLRAAPE